ncbi:uncharacterized protein MELLADRAFT_105764 [Melampsora larici-populina 98AG31]|uniref:Uncharacterized protein n=1 Tax=Melampsora larici-populina (strain 98AG31 / pathotype 3-4-7) TaxID=747676 RepID=F4RJ90_MELLP|nr:uncharacterized protein MELLADRAFT_105764 [Melampsora larici-populina 98AG31]EGG07545.1 hypothetical protein MELLADRAFT_105764 [Melampsora larici-populina 98AG31]
MTFLPAGHTGMWHTYLGFLRPVAISFLQLVGKADIAQDMTTKLWVTCGQGTLDTEDFSNILKSRFIEGGVAPLGISQWQHVSVAITDAHIKIAPPPVAEGENSMFDYRAPKRSAMAIRPGACVEPLLRYSGVMANRALIFLWLSEVDMALLAPPSPLRSSSRNRTAPNSPRMVPTSADSRLSLSVTNPISSETGKGDTGTDQSQAKEKSSSTQKKNKRKKKGKKKKTQEEIEVSSDSANDEPSRKRGKSNKIIPAPIELDLDQDDGVSETMETSLSQLYAST